MAEDYFYCNVNNAVGSKIYVSGECWISKWKKGYRIDFSEYSALPECIILAAKKLLRVRLSTSGPNAIQGMRSLLSALEAHWERKWIDLGSASLMDWAMVWDSERINGKRLFREELSRFYRGCANAGLANANTSISLRINSWSCRTNRKLYRNLLSWDAENGALVSSELELLRKSLCFRSANETWSERFIRILLWVCVETLKRPCQIVEMLADALVKITSVQGGAESFLRLPKAKRQIGRKAELWPISESLSLELDDFVNDPLIRKLQIECNRLLVHHQAKPEKPTYNIQTFINRWVCKKNIISPRTSKLLHLTPTRIRHSGATALALRGVPISEIQYILEHDSSDSCYVYLDAIGSELCPVVEKVDRKLGGIFTRLAEFFFKGKLASELTSKVVLIPVLDKLAVVGNCGLSGNCTKHPFFKCYDGCRHFIAWRNADHRKALDFVQSELDRWKQSEGKQERSKAIKDFEILYAAISQVINLIELGG